MKLMDFFSPKSLLFNDMRNKNILLLVLLFFSGYSIAREDNLENKKEKILNETMLRLAWSAMDQSYANEATQLPLKKGSKLFSPDNLADKNHMARKMPWDIPNTFVVYHDTGINHTGGRAIVYEDLTGNTIMVSMMGTNGNGDVIGWEQNIRDMALMQFIKYGKARKEGSLFSLGRTVMDDVRLLTKRSRDKGITPNLIFVGDSKGGAQAQMLLASYISFRDFYPRVQIPNGLHYDPFEYVSNKNIALVAHSSPGAVDSIKNSGFGTDITLYSGIEMHYSFAHNGRYPELISTIGEYLGVGKSNPSAIVVKYKTSYWGGANMHRLGISGYDYFNTGGNFQSMTVTDKPVWIRNVQKKADFLNATRDYLRGLVD